MAWYVINSSTALKLALEKGDRVVMKVYLPESKKYVDLNVALNADDVPEALYPFKNPTIRDKHFKNPFMMFVGYEID